jgi:hypothetical protein
MANQLGTGRSVVDYYFPWSNGPFGSMVFLDKFKKDRFYPKQDFSFLPSYFYIRISPDDFIATRIGI